MFAQDRLNGTSAYAHSVGYQLHIDVTIFRHHIHKGSSKSALMLLLGDKEGAFSIPERLGKLGWFNNDQK